MIIILKPRRHSRLWEEEEKKREKRKRRYCGGGTPTFWGVLLLLDGSGVRGHGCKPEEHRGAELSGGGSTSLNPTFYPRPSPMDEAIKSPGDGTFRERREGGSAKNKGTVSLERVAFCFPSLFRFVVRSAPTKPPVLCAFP